MTHTRLTYHRTWETGLRVAIRVTAFSPAFFCPQPQLPIHLDLIQSRLLPDIRFLRSVATVLIIYNQRADFQSIFLW